MAHALKISEAKTPDGPTISMSTVENIAARKFLRFALEDVAYQMAKMKKDPRMKPREYQDAHDGALIITAYFETLLAELDRVIETAMKGSLQ